MPESIIPQNHPRAASLNTRHQLINGMKEEIVTESGLIAHGRGEAFDYLFGEKTHQFAMHATKVAAAKLFLSKNPVISINGNVTILSGKELVKFSNTTRIPLEINLFYYKPSRIKAIHKKLTSYGAKYVLSVNKEDQIELDSLNSYRRWGNKNGIIKADVVLVLLEDGDRTKKLVEMNKIVISIDLNPLSRTVIYSQIAIIDNLQRSIPHLSRFYQSMTKKCARKILKNYNHKKNLLEALDTISQYYITELKKRR